MRIAVIAGERHFLAVADEVLGKERVGVRLIVVAEEGVEAMLFGHAGSASGAIAPFAEAASCITGPFEHRAERFFAFAEWIEAAVGADRRVACVLAGKQRTARRRTDRPARQALRKSHAFGG